MQVCLLSALTQDHARLLLCLQIVPITIGFEVMVSLHNCQQSQQAMGSGQLIGGTGTVKDSDEAVLLHRLLSTTHVYR